jgi:flagella basal body P-ring formation protein FlgA
VEIRYLGVERELDCPEGADFLVESSPSERFRGHADLRIRGHHHGVPCEQIRIRPLIQVWIQAVVASERAQVGEPVRLVEKRVLLSSVSGDNVTLDSGPWLSTTTLDVGEVVTRSKVRARPDVRGGHRVVIVAGAAPLSIRSDGRLLSDAKLGDEVRVANLGTGTVVNGVLIEPDLVRAGGTR